MATAVDARLQASVSAPVYMVADMLYIIMLPYASSDVLRIHFISSCYVLQVLTAVARYGIRLSMFCHVKNVETAKTAWNTANTTGEGFKPFFR